MRRLIELTNSPDERVALMAADKVLERAWGKPKEMPDTPENPEMTEKRRLARERMFAALEQMAKPMYEVEAQQPALGRREPHRPMARTDPPPPDNWEG
jgi:hypothetical protein